ncbi:MAG: hypothetical protein D6761_12175 [Candidatus Dadabacteria bacterium]|nr:MAG: hypothetical protein D6761_12175 [Candidatus Dadabacteria bacterium]
MPLPRDLQKQFQARAQETIMKLMQDERTRPMVAKAMQTYMESRQRVDQVRDETAHNLGLVTKGDLDKVSSRLRKLERQLDRFEKRLEQAEAALSS